MSTTSVSRQTVFGRYSHLTATAVELGEARLLAGRVGTADQVSRAENLTSTFVSEALKLLDELRQIYPSVQEMDAIVKKLDQREFTYDLIAKIGGLLVEGETAIAAAKP
jgi:hypothetical protein